MTDSIRASEEPILDEEATGIDRPGLHSQNGELPRNEHFGEVLARNIARRSFLLGAAASVPVLMTSKFTGEANAAEGAAADAGVIAPQAARDRLTFKPIQPTQADMMVVPENYTSQVLVSWGDPLFEGGPEFVASNQSRKSQEAQFGFNCDFVGYFPLEDENSALLCVNHEYTSGADMFRNYKPGENKKQADVEIAAHGGSVIEIRKRNGAWSMVKSDRYNRRITGRTKMTITGPAAGHDMMKTSEDPKGRTVFGMLNNCAGGKTPWGTWLTCEENFNQYFANAGQITDPEARTLLTRYGVTTGATGRRWEAFYDRFDVLKEPNEPNRFGWVVEIDPYDPTFVPRKRTALGRTKHEAATCILAKDGRVVVYSGDDQQFDYVYKFVSKNKYNADDRLANLDLLDEGTLYVAKFNDDGTGRWLELSMNNPVLAAMFENDGEILVKTRLAADAVGATAMDRPEDCQPNPVTGKVYLTMTNNSARTTLRPDAGEVAANPRVPNPSGHIIEVDENRGDHASTKFEWRIFLLCGNPEIDLKTDKSELTPGLSRQATFFAGYADADKLGKVGSPDNIAFDAQGNLWIATDGQPSNVDIGNPNDALHVVPTAGPDRGYLRQFLSGPKGCEVCGPEFSDNFTTLFVAIQHPGEGGGFPNTISRWPDNTPYARPALVVVQHDNDEIIGR
jgi:secreted PhoX family phosphatase